MAQRHPIRIGIEVALVCALVGVLVYRFVGVEESVALPGIEVSRETRLEAFAKKRAEAAREAAWKQARDGSWVEPELADEGFSLAPTDEEELAPFEDGVLLLRVEDGSGQSVAGDYVLYCPEAAYTSRVSSASLRFDLPAGTYRFGAVQEWGEVVLEAAARDVRVVEGRAVSLTLRLVPPKTADVGIGLSLRKVGEWFEVAAVFAGSPAERSGIRVGDVIIEIDGVPADEVGRVSEAEARLRGASEQAVSLVLALPDGEGWRATAVEVQRGTSDR